MIVRFQKKDNAPVAQYVTIVVQLLLIIRKIIHYLNDHVM